MLFGGRFGMEENKDSGYSSGESVRDYNRIDFKTLKTESEQADHLKALWKSCWLKLYGS